MTHPDDGRTRPVIIYRGGAAPQAALMNAKAYQKSLEQGELWTLHQETGRLIPSDAQGALRSLTEEAGWYVAELAPGEGEGEGEGGASTASTAPESPAPAAEGAQAGRSAAADSQPAREPSAPGNVAPGAGSGSDTASSGVLGSLQGLIDRRRVELPEGSYTTHLFTKGSEKIRKKTGEEAVELILASSRENLVYEAADLLYHMMVLLSAEELSIEMVLEELRRRHAGE